MSYATSNPGPGHMTRQSRPRGVPTNSQRSQPPNMHMGTSPQHQNLAYQHALQQQGYIIPQQLIPGQPMTYPQPQLASMAQYPFQYYVQSGPSPNGQSPLYYNQHQQQMTQGGQMSAPSQSQAGGPGRPTSAPGMAAGPQMMQQQQPHVMSQSMTGPPGGYSSAQQQMQVNAAAQYGMPQRYNPPQQQTAPQMNQPPPQIPSHTQPAPPQKRAKKVISIVNPDTHEVVNRDAVSASGSTIAESTSSTPPSSNRSTPIPPSSSDNRLNSSKPAAPATAPATEVNAVRSSSSENAIAQAFKSMVVSKISSSNTSANSESSVTPSASVNGDVEPAEVVKPDAETPDLSQAKDKEETIAKASAEETPVKTESQATKEAPAEGDGQSATKAASDENKANISKTESSTVGDSSTAAQSTPDTAKASDGPAKSSSSPPEPVSSDKPTAASDDSSNTTTHALPSSTTKDEPRSSPVKIEPIATAVTPAPSAEKVSSTDSNDLSEVETAVKVDTQASPPPAEHEAKPPTQPAASSTNSVPESAPKPAAVASKEEIPEVKESKSIDSKVSTPAALDQVKPASPPVTSSDKKTSLKNSTDTQLMPPPPAPVSSSPIDDKENSPIPSPATKTQQAAPPPFKGSKSVMADTSKVPDYKYKEDLSRPLNPEAKKVYDRDFLMSLQKVSLSQTKPVGLPILNEILNKNPGGEMRLVGRRDMNPDFFKPTNSPRASLTKGRSVNRDREVNKGGSQGGRMSQQASVIGYKRPEAKLKRSDNAWKITDKASSEDVGEEDKQHDELLKTFRGILNKLTPQNFKNLLEKIFKLPVKSEKDLDDAMQLVFEKAIAEPAFSVTYANLCLSLSKEFKVPSEADPSQEVSFRKLLLVRCQKEFEKSNSDDEEMKMRKAAIEAAAKEEKAKLEEELELFTTKARRRTLGNIRFIGELFKLGMLLVRIMHDCVVSLLKGGDEESLECLCRLLTTIGNNLDTEREKPRTDQYFKEMKKIVNRESSKKVSARIRFALQDVIELRENNWVPRRENTNPKTIKEIHAEAALEAHEKQMMIDKSIPSRGSQNRMPLPRPDRNRGRDEEAGWNHVMKSQRVDPSKLKLTKQAVGDSDVQLGPARGFGSNWGKGSSGSGKSTPPQQEERPSTPTNRFSALSGDGRDERSRSGNRLPPSRGSVGRGQQMNRGSGNRLSNTPRGSVEKDRDRSNVIATVRQLSRSGGSRGPSRENSVEGRNMRTPTPTRTSSGGAAKPAAASNSKPSAAPVKQLSKDEWDIKVKAVIDEYLHNKDIKEVLECIRELGAQTNKELITEISINHTLERSQAARRSTGLMLAELIKHELLPLDQHIKALTTVLEFADDLAIDIPNVWEYFGEFISPMFITAAVPLNKLEAVSTTLLSIGKAATLVAAILEEASHNIGHVELGKRWIASNLKWSTFLPEGESEEEFIKSNKLEYTLVSAAASSSTSGKSSPDLAATLEKLLIASSAPNESVFDWIDVNLSSEEHTQQAFIRSLTTVVARACIEDNGFVEKLFKGRVPLLSKYYDSKPEREGFALAAMEELMDSLQHPANLLMDFCYQLSDEELISDESFYLWEKTSKNGIAIKSVAKFHNWLREEEGQQQAGSEVTATS